jgi:2-amino-4-hydroxy-6-hydroxymethyldihydropteridine diphosphokinase
MRAAAARWCPAYVGIGSNLDSPEEQVLTAIAALGSLPDTVVTSVSSLYRSEPMGPVRQADFVNAVAAMLTLLSPHKLLAELRAIEDAQGRKRDGEYWGPRTIDLDLLVFGSEEIDDGTLTVPHPGIRARNFVLLPLCELAPQLIVPGVGTVAALTSAVSASGGRIEKISESLT